MIACLLHLFAALTLSNLTSPPPFAQQPECPTVTVSCAASDCVDPPFRVRANVSGLLSGTQVSYEWTVVGGEVTSGQGTSNIEIHAPNWSSVTATVKLGGIATHCRDAIASISFLRHELPPLQKLDQFSGSASFVHTRRSLDKLAYELRNQPGTRGCIVSSGKWALQTRAERYLKTQGFESPRIVYVQVKAERPPKISLYIVPHGVSCFGS